MVFMWVRLMYSTSLLVGHSLVGKMFEPSSRSRNKHLQTPPPHLESVPDSQGSEQHAHSFKMASPSSVQFPCLISFQDRLEPEPREGDQVICHAANTT